MQTDKYKYNTELIAQKIKEKGWSYKVLAERSDVSATTIYKILNEKQRATINNAGKIANALGIKVKECSILIKTDGANNERKI